MITVKQHGDFSVTTRYFQKLHRFTPVSILEKYAMRGVQELSNATPVDTGKTASSWHYEINKTSKGYRLNFYNTNVNKGIPISILIQYGHATRNGGWVEGRDYINPALAPIFDKIAEDAWKEVTTT